MRLRRPMLVALALLAIFPLSGCGRKGLPIPPEGATFPRTYPEVTFPDGPGAKPPADAGTDSFAPPSLRTPTQPFRLEHPGTDSR